MSQIRTLMKQGGSTVVSIPPYMLAELGLTAGDPIKISYYKTGVLTFEPHPPIVDPPMIKEVIPPP